MKLYCICVSSDGSKDPYCNMRTLKMIQGLGGHQLLETVGKDCKVVSREHQMMLKLMEDQLHINLYTVHKIMREDSWKEEYLHDVCSTQSYWWANGAQSYSLWKIRCGMVEISHPPYSPNLIPANIFTITKVKVTSKEEDFRIPRTSRT